MLVLDVGNLSPGYPGDLFSFPLFSRTSGAPHSLMLVHGSTDRAAHTLDGSASCLRSSVRTVAYLVDLPHRLAPFRAEPAVRMIVEQIGLLVQ
ncbi:MAG: hypothetical protein ACRDP1_11840 [Nocardioidaceae bacterium]